MSKHTSRSAMLMRAFAALIFSLLSVMPIAARTGDALAGHVTSDAEGKMEGVLVIAQRDGSAVLTSVVTDAQGRYHFPRTHLQPGNYKLMIRAAGYVLPSDSASVTINPDRTAKLNLHLRPATTDELAHQLTNVDWWTSMPGTTAEKDVVIRKMANCGSCHDLERVVGSSYTAERFLPVMQRMSTYDGDNSSGCGTGSALSCDVETRGRVQGGGPLPSLDKFSWGGADAHAVAEYLASVNLSGGKSTWNYRLKPMPRPKGRATHVIVTVFPIPRQPSVTHDLAVDAQGNVWYGDSGWGYLGKFDPKTGQFSEYEAPNIWPDPPPGRKRIVGVQDIEVDPAGNIWIAAINGKGMIYFNPATERWTQFDMPAATWAFLPAFRSSLNTIWTTGRERQSGGPAPLKAYRLNYTTGKVEASFPIMVDASGADISGPKRLDLYGYKNPVFPLCYQIEQDLQGNFLCADFYGSSIVRVDAETGARTIFPTPTPNSAPRRGHVDSQGRFWFGEYWGDKIGMLDLKTGNIREFAFSAKYASGYAAAGDRHGEGWGTSQGGDRVLRVNPATGETIEYLMPVYTDARKIVVDPSTDKTTIWLPNKNLAQLIRIEAQD